MCDGSTGPDFSELGQISCLPHILPAMFSGKRMSSQYSLFLFGIHCDFTSYEYYISTKQICSVILAGQRGCEKNLHMLENMKRVGGRLADLTKLGLI
jgi:hypothetical protein